MKKLNPLLLIILITLSFTSCQEEVIAPIQVGANTQQQASISNYINIYIDGILSESIEYTDSNKILNVKYYNIFGDSVRTYDYFYSNNGSEIDYVKCWKPSGNYPVNIDYTYTNGLLTEFHYEDVTYNVFYDANNVIESMRLVNVTCHMYYDYIGSNVSIAALQVLPGWVTDSLAYDNMVNPFSKLWPYGGYKAEFLSQNNIVYKKHLRVLDSNYGTYQPPDITVSEELTRYDYTYDYQNRPLTKTAINLTCPDTVEYRYEYL